MNACELALPESDNNMSNFDHSIGEGMAEDLRNGMRSEHCAWGFYGLVWFDDGMFHEQVLQSQLHVATISAPTLRELMDEVNSQYGSA